jgi:hypothetical protein
MPLTYLGLPLGTTRPVVQDYLLLASKVERRTMGITPFLSYAGRMISHHYPLSIFVLLRYLSPSLTKLMSAASTVYVTEVIIIRKVVTWLHGLSLPCKEGWRSEYN